MTLLHGRAKEIEELQNRLAAEQQALRGRETNLAQAEQSLSILQEQLRRRSDELTASERKLADQAQHDTQEGTDSAAARWRLVKRTLLANWPNWRRQDRTGESKQRTGPA